MRDPDLLSAYGIARGRMTVREFVSHLQESLDYSRMRGIAPKEVVISFVAPNSHFCGPTIRPTFLGVNGAGEGRYGITRRQAERLLEAFNVTLPPEFGTV